MERDTIEWNDTPYQNGSFLSRSDFFTVHIAFLRTTVKENGLRELFMKAGDVKQVFIPHFPAGCKTTYAFVRYATLEEAKIACKIFNKTLMNGSCVDVTLSRETRLKIEGDLLEKMSPPHNTGVASKTYSTKSNSILRERNNRQEVGGRFFNKTKENEIHTSLKSSVKILQNKNDSLTKWLNIESKNDVEVFMGDFKEVLTKMVNVADEVPHRSITQTADVLKKKDIEDVLLRYHEVQMSNSLLSDIDLDLTNGEEKISSYDYNDFFNLFENETEVDASDAVIDKNISNFNFSSGFNLREQSFE